MIIETCEVCGRERRTTKTLFAGRLCTDCRGEYVEQATGFLLALGVILGVWVVSWVAF